VSTKQSSKRVRAIVAGAAISIASFAGLDWVSGGFLRAGAKIPQLNISSSLHCPGLSETTQRTLATSVSLRNLDNLELNVAPFDDILDGAERTSAIRACERLTFILNFRPNAAWIASRNGELPQDFASCGDRYCLALDSEALLASRGRIRIDSGIALSRQSLSTKAVNVAVTTQKPDTQVQLEVDLPEGYVLDSASPGPDHVSSMAWTRMYWRSTDLFGRTAPKAGPMAPGPRARLQEIGVELRISDPQVRRLETTLAFLFGALFAIGFGLAVEGPFRRWVGDP